jgi:hypothetical protein
VSSVEAWFRRHRARVDAHDTSTVALLSTLLPDKRSDRVYCIQASRLEKIIGRGLGLGLSRISDLKRYSEPDNASDLADCVERVMNATVGQFIAWRTRCRRADKRSQCKSLQTSGLRWKKWMRPYTDMLQR